MKMKSNVILNDDKVIKERLKYCVHITLGRFLNIQRTVSPLSHEKVAGQTTINSSTTWNMEQVRNYSILSYAQVIYTQNIQVVKLSPDTRYQQGKMFRLMSFPVVQWITP